MLSFEVFTAISVVLLLVAAFCLFTRRFKTAVAALVLFTYAAVPALFLARGYWHYHFWFVQTLTVLSLSALVGTGLLLRKRRFRHAAVLLILALWFGPGSFWMFLDTYSKAGVYADFGVKPGTSLKEYLQVALKPGMTREEVRSTMRSYTRVTLTDPTDRNTGFERYEFPYGYPGQIFIVVYDKNWRFQEVLQD